MLTLISVRLAKKHDFIVSKKNDFTLIQLNYQCICKFMDRSYESMNLKSGFMKIL
jgi:hypothetical protein